MVTHQKHVHIHVRLPFQITSKKVETYVIARMRFKMMVDVLSKNYQGKFKVYDIIT